MICRSGVKLCLSEGVPKVRVASEYGRVLVFELSELLEFLLAFCRLLVLGLPAIEAEAGLGTVQQE